MHTRCISPWTSQREFILFRDSLWTIQHKILGHLRVLLVRYFLENQLVKEVTLVFSKQALL